MSYGGEFEYLNDGAINGAITIGTTPVQVMVGVSPYADRKLVIMQPKDTGIFYGFSNSVTTSNGIEIFKDQIVPLECGPDNQIWAVASSNGRNMRVQELK